MREPREALSRLRRLLRERNDSPERQAEIDAAICAEFQCRRAVMVLDMAGFSRMTVRHGIIHYLAMIEQMAGVALSVVHEYGARLCKRDADNLLVLFDEVEQAVRAAARIMAALDQVNERLPEDRRLYVSAGIGYGDMLVLDEDMFGGELNLASKLGEDLAEREILLTAAAREQLPSSFRCRERRFAISGLDLVAYRAEVGADEC